MKELGQPLQLASDLSSAAYTAGDRVIYQVCTDNRLYQDSLLHIGFAQAGNGCFSRNLSARGDIVAIYARFTHCLRDMLRQSAREIPVNWEHALRLFLGRIEGTRLNWFLYGSAALAIRGIGVTPGDLDIRVNDAELAGRLLEDLLVEPVTDTRGWIADKIGRAYSGCIIEWLAGVHATRDDQPNEQGHAAAERLEHVEWNGWHVPVAPLDLQLAVLDWRGLSERATKVRAYMESL